MIRSARSYASVSLSATRRSMPRSSGSAARSNGLRDWIGCFLLLTLRYRPRQQASGEAEAKHDEDQQPARRFGQRCGSLFLRFVTDHEDLFVRAICRLADHSALLQLTEQEGQNVRRQHHLLAAVYRI